ncbi:12124_t:CDS:2, partial [Entrophospora sp. SA101]
MPKPTKQKAHLNRLALDKKNNSSSGNENQLETNLEQFSCEESEESWFEEGIDRELDENSVKYIDILNESIKNYTSSSRLLCYIGNSSRTYYWKQSEAKKNAEKNGQLITAFFEKSRANLVVKMKVLRNLLKSIGLLKLSPEVKERINDEKFPTEACVFLSIGKQHEGYGNIQKLAEQM